MKRIVFVGLAVLTSVTACSTAPTQSLSSAAVESTATPPAAATTPAAPTTTPTSPETTAAIPATPNPLLTVADLVASPRPIVLAHAGGEDQHPHSTPFAFGESVKAGVDMLDFDVQLTADGVLVVQHDDTVDRTTNGTGSVAEMTYADISALDNAYWFTADCTCRDQPEPNYVLRGMRSGEIPPVAGYVPEDFVIPRFRDVVAKYPLMPLNIEIKGGGELAVAAAQTLANELAEFNALDRSVVTSFDDTVIAAFHDFAPSVALSPGLTAATAWVLDGTPLPLGMTILQLPPEFNGIQVLTPQTVQLSHAAGYVIWVWPNDRARWENPAGYQELLEMGMDGLNINFPAAGVAAVANFTGDSLG
jgi:glycerophosphoryl diester phosphodiesterase